MNIEIGDILIGNYSIYAETAFGKPIIVTTISLLESIKESQFVKYDEIDRDSHGNLWVSTYMDIDGNIKQSKKAKYVLKYEISLKVLKLHVLKVHEENEALKTQNAS